MAGHSARKASFPSSSTSPTFRLSPPDESHSIRSIRRTSLVSAGVPAPLPHLHTPPIPMQHIEFDVAFYPQRICRITCFATHPDPQHCRNAGRHASHGMLRVAENPMRAAYPTHALRPTLFTLQNCRGVDSFYGSDYRVNCEATSRFFVYKHRHASNIIRKEPYY